jgi:hypothetical protein
MSNSSNDVLDLDALLHPAGAFAHPSEVLRDPDLTVNEKRAILASWASDACAVEAAPALRTSATGRPVRFDDVMDALRELDAISGAAVGVDAQRKARRRTIIAGRRGRSGESESGSPLY